MAKYDYECYRCGEKLVVEIPMKEYDPENPPICPKCNQCRMTRVITSAIFHLVGGGWFKDGY